jgi:hypothetical protein
MHKTNFGGAPVGPKLYLLLPEWKNACVKHRPKHRGIASDHSPLLHVAFGTPSR